MTIAMKNEALPHGKNRKTTKSALATSETTPIISASRQVLREFTATASNAELNSGRARASFDP